ncbi:MAG: metallophosphoesterase [Deltaproteobacteria bacterium]|nr:metallophosphoesterase [Deltaproteobacteria bacterium]
MRVLQLSDTHLGAKLRVEGAPKGWSRHEDHLAALDAALALVDQVDLVVHAGDLFDSASPPAEVVEQAVDRLTAVAARVPVLIIPGNHERNGLTGLLPCDASGLTVADGARRLSVAGLTVGLVPFERDAGRWAHASRVAVGAGVDLLVHHQGVDGARVPGYTFRSTRHSDVIATPHIPEGVRWMASGHIHLHQCVPGPGWSAVYAGSTERSAFVEGPQAKGAVLWDFEEDVRWRFVPLGARPMRELHALSDLRGVEMGELVLVRESAWVQAALDAGAWVVRGRRLKPRGPGRR